MGSPKEYADSAVSLRPSQEISRDKLLNDLVDIQFERNDIDFQRGKFRVRGDVVEIFPASRDEHAFREKETCGPSNALVTYEKVSEKIEKESSSH